MDCKLDMKIDGLLCLNKEQRFPMAVYSHWQPEYEDLTAEHTVLY